MEEPQLENLTLHVHCETCVKINKCTVRPQYGESCEIVSCSVKCGAKFHACKASEHELLCLNEKVPCINAVNGCPLWMPRKHRGRHLETCPASVVHCTMEWNRWPVCSRERQLHIPFHQPNPHVRPGQLDVSLAMRDQRMLNEWIHAPRKARQAMRNGLTRHFPAVPFQLGNRCDPESELSDHNLCSEEALWELRKAPPGLKRSVCSELYKASKQTTDSLSAALKVITSHAHNAEKKINGEIPLPMEEDKENCNGLANGWSSATHHPQKSLKTSTDSMDMELDTFEAHSEAEIDSDRMELAPELPEIESNRNFDVLFVDNTIVSEISSASMTDHARKQPSPLPPPPPTSPPMFVNLGLDLTLESITRYQTKPKSMYTFLCAQEFRRDEYSWHYQNVHSDIHGGLNGWLEQRCPLAHYGCMFSVRRFFPASPGSMLVHNDILESFGVKPKANKFQESTEEKKNKENSYQSTGLDDSTVQSQQPSSSIPASFSEFPFEVLQHIARFLDSFSLCNLAMTSLKLREVCCSLLEERGIVVQQWERQWNGERGTWKAAYKRWYFSTAFTPVLWWGFEDKESMANHLQKCIYFQRNVKTEPYYYPMQTKPNQLLYEKLYAAAKCSASKSQATKL